MVSYIITYTANVKYSSELLSKFEYDVCIPRIGGVTQQVYTYPVPYRYSFRVDRIYRAYHHFLLNTLCAMYIARTVTLHSHQTHYTSSFTNHLSCMLYYFTYLLVRAIIFNCIKLIDDIDRHHSLPRLMTRGSLMLYL